MKRRVWIPFVLLGVAAAVLTVATPGARDLVRQLGAESAVERDKAARALRALGERATPALEAAARSGTPAVRRRARALLDLERHGTAPGSPAAARAARAVVVAAVRDPHGLQPGSARDRLLDELGRDGGRALSAAARHVATRSLLPPDIALALARHAHPETLRALVDLLEARRLAPSSVLLAARELERHDDMAPGASDLRRVTAATREGSGPARRGAVALFAALGRADAVDGLVELCADRYSGVRQEAARALGRIAPARGATVLRLLAGDRDAGVRREALDALARVPGPPEPEPALANADHADPRVRAAAARLLGRDATPRALPTLDRLAQDDALSVRRAARRSRSRLGLTD